MTSTIPQRSETRHGAAYVALGEGEPLLLVHGVGLRLEAWAPQIGVLAASCRVIAVDLPGHGGSAPLPADAALPDFVDWLKQLIDDLACGPVNLCGHSMGALIALGLALSHPASVRRVALICAVHRRDSEARDAVLARAADIANGAVDIDGPLRRWFQPERSTREAQSAVLTRRWLSEVSQRGYATAYRAFAEGDAVYADRLSKLACPALFLTGEFDANSSPRMAEAMGAEVPNARVVVVPGEKHMVHLVAPERVNCALRDWLRQPTQQRSGGPSMAVIDPRALRDAFGTFLTGVTVVTTMDSGHEPRGFTANSFASVSLDPPLLLVCLAKSSTSLDTFRSAAGFAVNILSEKQQAVSTTFATPVADRFGAVNWRLGPYGSPVLAGVAAWFDCAVHNSVDAGDHVILIGQVKAFEAGVDNGLGYARGSYFTLGLERRAATVPPDASVTVSAIIERNGQVLLFEDAAGSLTLPTAQTTAKVSAVSQLGRLVAETGLLASIGFIYSVYEDRGAQENHIVYHCIAGEGRPKVGVFLDFDHLPFDRVGDPATESVLRRFLSESRMGQFNVYFGDERRGETRRLDSED